jgi:hypothetical protein
LRCCRFCDRAVQRLETQTTAVTAARILSTDRSPPPEGWPRLLMWNEGEFLRASALRRSRFDISKLPEAQRGFRGSAGASIYKHYTKKKRSKTALISDTYYQPRSPAGYRYFRVPGSYFFPNRQLGTFFTWHLPGTRYFRVPGCSNFPNRQLGIFLHGTCQVPGTSGYLAGLFF